MKRFFTVFLTLIFLMSCSAFAEAKKAGNKAKPQAAKTSEVKSEFPSVDIVQTTESLILIVELPGISKKDISVEYIEGEKNYIEITGTKGDIKLKASGNKILSERHVGKFVRKIDIPERIMKDKITAEFENGILLITLPILKYQIKTSIKIK